MAGDRELDVAEVSCRVVSGLLSRWYDGTLADTPADAYEQHLLLCPPCLAHSQNLRTALAALPAAASRTDPPVALIRDLVAGLGRAGEAR